MTTPQDEERKQLAEWLTQLERTTAATYGSLDGSASRLRRDKIKGLRLGLETKLLALNKLVRTRGAAAQQATVDERLATLLAIKLVRDDTMLVELELLAAQPSKTTTAAQQREGIRKDYTQFVKNWIAASPLIHPDTVKWLWPNIRDAKGIPFIRGVDVFNAPVAAKPASRAKGFDDLRASPSTRPADLQSPLELSRAAVQRELKALVANPRVVEFSRSTLHLIGVAYILAQVELAMRFSNDQCFQREVSSWYEFAGHTADAIRELLGALDVPIREAVRDGQPSLRDKLHAARRHMLATLSLYYSVPALEGATLVAFAKGAGRPNEVVGVNGVTEKVTVRAGLVREDRALGRDTMLGYMASTGFTLVYPLREVDVPPARPALRWGRIAQVILIRAWRESLEHWHQISFSVSETVAEQHELIADLLAFDEVGKAFKAALKRKPTLDLIDRTVRGRALAAAMKTLNATLSSDEALLAMIALIQRYLSYFTRHTGDNVRDSGTPYLSSRWPTDLNGRQFFDCGVYAVESAFDLMRVAKAAKGLTLEFRFLVFPEHVALVVYRGQSCFAVNNARIFAPRPFPVVKPGVSAKDAAGFSWATLAMQDAFSARFAVVPVMLSGKTLSSTLSEAGFKTAIWAMYQSITGFDIVKEVGKAYFDSSKAFDAGSTLLTLYLLDLESGKLQKKDTDALLDLATELTDGLYLMSEVLAHSCNFVDTKSGGFVTAIGIHVNGEDPLVQAAKLQQQLPMYAFVGLLQQPGLKLSAAQQALTRRSTGKAHASELTEALGLARCTPKFRQSLAATHLAGQAAIAQLIAKAPQRIAERIQAARAASDAASGRGE